MEDNDSRLLRKLAEDFQIMSGSITRMSTLFEEWAPTWRRQGDGLVDLTNRQTKQEGRLDLLVQQFETDKHYRESLESIAIKASEERAAQAKMLKEQAEKAAEDRETQAKEFKKQTDESTEQRRQQFRFVVMAIVGIVGLLLSILAFLWAHFGVKQ